MKNQLFRTTKLCLLGVAIFAAMFLPVLAQEQSVRPGINKGFLDPDLKVEFYHNGKPLKQGSRIHTLCDFGYVALDIAQLIEADGGEYTCRVYNKYGETK